MPTFEERAKESNEEFNQRLEAKTLEMGITYTFAQYIDQLESYILQLENRVKTLEKKVGIDPVEGD